MEKRISSYFTVILLVLLSTVLLWLPFIFRVDSWLGLDFSGQNFFTIYKHYDGLLYIVPAKTWYSPVLIKSLGLEIPLPIEYFAAHLPLFPFFIRLFSFIGYMKAMVLVTLFFSIAAAVFFYFLVQNFKITQKPLSLVVVFIFLTRFLIVRSIGAPETLFIFLVLVSVYFFEKEKYVLAGILGALATMTKSPGILLGIAYGLVFIERFIKTHKFKLNWLAIGIIPLGLLAVFVLYMFRYGDFWAYFHSGDNIHLVYPFAVFNFKTPWVGTAWVEEIIFYFFLYGLTVVNLKDSKYRSFFYFPLVFLVATTFVQHRDIARYSLPIWPFACIAFERFFTSKRFMFVLLLLLPAIYLYAWNFLLYNVMPVADWKAYL